MKKSLGVLVSSDNWEFDSVSQKLPFKPVSCRYWRSLYQHCMIPVSFLPRPSGNRDLHLHVLTRLQEAIALCCAVQEQLAKTRCAFFKGKFIGVLFFYLRSQQPMLFITKLVELAQRAFIVVFLEQGSWTEDLCLACLLRWKSEEMPSVE